MTVLFHVTMPDGPLAALDAVMQDIQLLQKQCPGSQINHLYPGTQPGTRWPRRWWGVHQFFRLRRAEQHVQLHHIFNPDPFPFAVLRWLKKPIVYTAVTGLGHTPKQTVQKLARQVHTLVLPTQADHLQLQKWGIKNSAVIQAGIDTNRFYFQPTPADAPFTLMMGSAPWTKAQFHSKGIDALLAAAGQLPDLHLIFLWRGLLASEITHRIQQANLSERVTVLNERVNVNEILGQVHGSIVLAKDPLLVKAFPHSLLESLVAGKPVLVSQTLALADYVKKNACGVIVPDITPQAILQAIDQLLANYPTYQHNSLVVGPRDFGQQQFVEAMLALYKTIPGAELLPDSAVTP